MTEASLSRPKGLSAKFRLSAKLAIAASKIREEFSDHRHLPPGGKAPKPENVPEDGHDDLCQLHAFEEPLILQTLQMRHHLQTVYTRIGARSILISINPYSKVEGRFKTSFYGGFTAQRYYKAAMDDSQSRAAELPPHVYQVAADAYVRCLGIGPIGSDKRQDQTIVATGESGAGKTENVKQILDFAAFSSRQPPQVGGATLSKMLDDANCILEAFGNAKTQRNDNSSRFGKLVTLFLRTGAGFPPAGELIGLKITTYLLEKPRLSRPNDGERNYHVFYQMLRGLGESELTRRGLKRLPPVPHPKETLSREFASEAEPSAAYEPILGANDLNVHAQWDDAADFGELRQALLTLMTRHQLAASIGGSASANKESVASALCDELWDVLAALLHLGRAKLVQDEEKTKGTNVTMREAGGVPMWANVDDLDWAARLLGMGGEGGDGSSAGSSRGSSGESRNDSLGFWMLHKKVLGQPKLQSLNKARAAHRACVQYLYAALFDWLIDAVNGACGCDDTGVGGVGGASASCCLNVLDIFGFESFKTNSLEQLCINLANERLQTNFEHVIFEQEKEEIAREGVDLGAVNHLDDMLDPSGDKTEFLIDGIFEQITGLIGGGDGMANQKLYSHIEAKVSRTDEAREGGRLKMESKIKGGKRPSWDAGDGTEFTIKHFAAPVTYDSSEMVEKSSMEGNPPLEALLLTSTSRLLRDVVECSRRHAAERTAAMKQAGERTKATVGVAFKRQLDHLTDKINRTEVHYVRCIKPNDNATSNEWDQHKVAEQLSNTGIFKAIRIRKYGFSQRVPHAQFQRDYVLGLPNEYVRALPDGSRLRKACKSWFRLGVCRDCATTGDSGQQQVVLCKHCAEFKPFEKETTSEMVKHLLAALHVPIAAHADVQVGTSKVLFRMSLEAHLEQSAALARKALSNQAIKVQARYRRRRGFEVALQKLRRLTAERRTLRAAVFRAAGARDAAGLESALGEAEVKLRSNDLAQLTFEVMRFTTVRGDAMNTLIAPKLPCSTQLETLRVETLPLASELAETISVLSRQPDNASHKLSSDGRTSAAEDIFEKLEAALKQWHELDAAPKLTLAMHALDVSESLRKGVIGSRKGVKGALATEKRSYVAWLERDCERARQSLASEEAAVHDAFSEVEPEGRRALERFRSLKEDAIKRRQERGSLLKEDGIKLRQSGEEHSTTSSSLARPASSMEVTVQPATAASRATVPAPPVEATVQPAAFASRTKAPTAEEPSAKTAGQSRKPAAPSARGFVWWMPCAVVAVALVAIQIWRSFPFEAPPPPPPTVLPLPSRSVLAATVAALTWCVVAVYKAWVSPLVTDATVDVEDSQTEAKTRHRSPSPSRRLSWRREPSTPGSPSRRLSRC